MRILGKITEVEKDEIEMLNEKVCALKNLVQIIPETELNTYSRCVQEYNEISNRYQCWWSDIMERYGWEVMEGENLNINFLTCDIFTDE